MQTSTLVRVVSALALLCLISEVGDAQAKNPVRGHATGMATDDRDRFRDFLSLFFPELKQRWVTLSVSEPDAFDDPSKRTERLFFVSASLARPDCGEPGHIPALPESAGIPFGGKDCVGDIANKNMQLLKAEFIVAQTRRFQTFAYSAPLIADKFQAILKLVRDHPEWSDEQAGEALRQAGAEFGPPIKPLLLKDLPLEALDEFLGKTRLESVGFQVRAKNVTAEDGSPDAEMLWEVHLSPIGVTKGRITYYWLLFEPFGGKLVSLGAAIK
jgi:hypothetical protein